MWPLKNISFFEGEKSISVNVACEQLTGTDLDTLFCTGWPESTKVHAPGAVPSRQESGTK
jgi:hypothetical protein